ncbi:MAG: hypothetical protein GY859_33120 [Desulfobacterales bacterium]|nr:hypothetical protein [Desulfobacterales bacterium]
MVKKCVLGFVSALLVLLSGWCVYAGSEGVVQTYKKATAPFNDEERVGFVPPPPGDTVQVKVKYQGGLFRTESRVDKIERFQCGQCHTNKKVTVERAAEMAHGDIELDHGGERPLSCFTCHKENNRDLLETEKGIEATMDHPYQICGQCHFRQKIDWIGGAHGKRVAYWAGQRVVKNCTSCHNPHSPRFEKRWPKTYSPPFSK